MLWMTFSAAQFEWISYICKMDIFDGLIDYGD